MDSFDENLIDKGEWKIDSKSEGSFIRSSHNYLDSDGHVLHIHFNRDKNNGNHKRAEIIRKGQQKEFEYGKEYWYQIRLLIPENWIFDNAHNMDIVTQWHHSKAYKYGGTMPLAISIRGDSWRIKSSSGNPISSNNFDKDAIKTTVLLDSLKIEKGVWINWRIHALWSAEDNGLIEIWKDGELVVKRLNSPNCYKDTGLYLKFGIYKPRWNKYPIIVNTRDIYFDDIIITDHYNDQLFHD